MSSTNLTAVAVLENPRVIPRSKTLVFDAQIFLPSSEPALVGSLRYFNADNVGFDDIGCYAVSVRVSPQFIACVQY
jgi:hypothetical protein